MSEGSDRQTPISADERIGPATIISELGHALGARVSLGELPDGGKATVWAWPSDQVSGDAIPRLLAVIEGLEGESVQGLATVVHGSLTPERAVVVFGRSTSRSLVDAVGEATLTPAQAIAGARDLVLATQAARERGFQVGRWALQEIACPADNEPWMLLSPGIRDLPMEKSATFTNPLSAMTMAPELMDEPQEDVATGDGLIPSEVYALGATLIYAVTGTWPWDAEQVPALQAAQRDEPPRSLREIIPNLAEHKRLQGLIHACLAPSPGDRPQGIEALLETLDSCMEEARRLARDGEFLPVRFTESVHQLAKPQRPPEGDVLNEGRGQSHLVVFILLVALLVFVLLFQVTAQAATGDGFGSPALDQRGHALTHPDTQGREAPMDPTTLHGM